MKNSIKVYVLSDENVPYTANASYKKLENVELSSDNIMVGEIDGEYTIVYTETVLQGMNPVDLVSSIAELFVSNLPGEHFVISLIYEYCLDYNFAVKEGISIKQISDTTLKILLIMEWRMAQNETGFIHYHQLQDFKDIQSMKLSDARRDLFGNPINDEEQDYEDADQEDNLTLDDIVGEMFGITLDSDDDDKEKKNKSKKDHHYTSSRILKSADNPKKMYKRHGVIVTDSRKAVKSDEKIIKKFLKDFIPGGGWRKDFRKDVLKRWLNNYAVSKKSLKILEKKHKKKIHKNKRGVIDADRAIALTRKLFATSTDIWNDPTK